jgi:pimeloyl-ACP methyl ester carboxylesterase
MNNTVYKSEESRKKVISFYDQELKKWPVPWRPLVIPTRSGDTYLIECGKPTNPPLILIHGASSNALTWAGDIKNYVENYRVICVDVIGEPGKSAQTRLPYEDESYAQWLSDVLDSLKLKKVILMGMSQGGFIALKYAVYHPERVSKLVLLAPGGIVQTKPSFLLIAILSMFFGKWGAHKLNSYVFGNITVEPIVLQFMDIIMNNINPRFDKEYIFTDNELRRLYMPVLLIGGLKDVIRSETSIKSRLEKLLPKFASKLLPDDGHVLINTASYVLPFLKSNG